MDEQDREKYTEILGAGKSFCLRFNGERWGDDVAADENRGNPFIYVRKRRNEFFAAWSYNGLSSCEEQKNFDSGSGVDEVLAFVNELERSLAARFVEYRYGKAVKELEGLFKFAGAGDSEAAADFFRIEDKLNKAERKAVIRKRQRKRGHTVDFGPTQEQYDVGGPWKYEQYDTFEDS